MNIWFHWLPNKTAPIIWCTMYTDIGSNIKWMVSYYVFQHWQRSNCVANCHQFELCLCRVGHLHWIIILNWKWFMLWATSTWFRIPFFSVMTTSFIGALISWTETFLNLTFWIAFEKNSSEMRENRWNRYGKAILKCSKQCESRLKNVENVHSISGWTFTVIKSKLNREMTLLGRMRNLRCSIGWHLVHRIQRCLNRFFRSRNVSYP